MTRHSLWTLTRQLNADGRLALFVGAGVSMGCGLPSWKDCVERVLGATWNNQQDFVGLLLKDRNILATRYARQKSGQRFNKLVHRALYQSEITISRCVQAIAKSGIRHICNFNFDDLIAEALLTEGAECQIAVPGERFSASQGGVVVYHPHGILPRFASDDEIKATKIVFSEDDYHNLYSDPHSWANLVQLALLTSKSVLFVGLSMQDANLRRLIDLTRSRGFTNQHIAVFRDPLNGCSKADRAECSRLRDLIELDMKSLGVTSWFVNSHEKVAEIIEQCAVESPRVRPKKSFKSTALRGAA